MPSSFAWKILRNPCTHFLRSPYLFPALLPFCLTTLAADTTKYLVMVKQNGRKCPRTNLSFAHLFIGYQKSLPNICVQIELKKLIQTRKRPWNKNGCCCSQSVRYSNIIIRRVNGKPNFAK